MRLVQWRVKPNGDIPPCIACRAARLSSPRLPRLLHRPAPLRRGRMAAHRRSMPALVSLCKTPATGKNRNHEIFFFKRAD